MGQAGQHLRREMQARGGRGHRALVAGEYGLVPVAVALLLLAAEVGRQRESSAGRIDRAVPAHQPGAVGDHRQHRADHPAHPHLCARPHFPPGSDQASPHPGLRFLQPQQLDATIVGEEARRDHLGVVEQAEVAGPEERGEVREAGVGHRAGRAVEHHHAGIGADGGRIGGDQPGRQRVVEVGRAQRHQSGRMRGLITSTPWAASLSTKRWNMPSSS